MPPPLLTHRGKAYNCNCNFNVLLGSEPMQHVNEAPANDRVDVQK